MEHTNDCAIHGCEGWNGARYCDYGTDLQKARNALRNLIMESEYSRTGKLPTSAELDKAETWWLTNATEMHSWDKRNI